MKNIFTGIFLLVSACFMQAQTPNYYRNPDKIYLDSKEGHNGSFTWQMHKADETKDPAEKISQPGYQTGKWMPAIVPGTVLNSLVHNKVYPEPYYGMNNKLDRNIIPDLAKTGREFYTYWFRTEFDVPENYKDKIVWLQVDGINYRAEIWVNGYLLGNMSGMFKPEYINITDFARIGQKNALAIKVYPVDMPGTIKPKQWGAAGEFHNGGDGNIGLNTTMLMSVGWDFTFNDGIRDRNTGIWKNISLYATDKAVIRHPFIKSELSKPNYDLAKETVSVEVTNPTQRGIKCTVKGEIIGENITFSKDLNLFRGETKEICFTPEEFPQLTIKNPRLWWPIFKGNPELYELKLTVSIDGKVSDETKTRFGIREITSDQNTPDKSRQFYVNGKKLFIRGTNWIPEGMLRTSDERTYAELRYTKQSGINLIRMWGGGTYEPDCFYEYCSEYGSLLMHDFMYACAFYPDHKNDFLFEAEREAEYQTKRLAHYPCMAIWTGNNEIAESYTDWFPAPIKPERFYGEKIFNYIQPRAGHRNSPLVPYMPSSPYFGDRANESEQGDVHAWSFFGRHPKTKFKFVYELEAFDRIPARFSSEYGFFGAQMESTVRRYLDGTEMRFDNPIWKHHGEFDRKRSNIDGAIDRHLTEFKTLDEHGYLLYSGIMQGLLYAELAEAMRRKPYGAGDLIWMYNDCWPETGWTIIDYYLTRKISFYFLKRAFATKKLIIRACEGGAEVTVINETPEAFTADIHCSYMTFTGETDSLCTKTLKVAPHSMQQFHISVCNDLKHGFFFASAEGFDTADSLRAYYRDYVFPESDAKIEKVEQDGNDLLVTIRASVYTPFAYLMTSDDRVHYDDNYVTLYPNEPKTLRVENCMETPVLHVAAPAPSEETKKASYTDSWF